jgi:hypothetical protein
MAVASGAATHWQHAAAVAEVREEPGLLPQAAVVEAEGLGPASTFLGRVLPSVVEAEGAARSPVASLVREPTAAVQVVA